MASFFLEFFVEPRHEFESRLPPGSLAASRRGFAFCVADPIGSAHESTRIDTNGESEALRRSREGARARRSSPLQRFVAIGVIRRSGFPRSGNSAVTILLTQLEGVVQSVEPRRSARGVAGGMATAATHQRVRNRALPPDTCAFGNGIVVPSATPNRLIRVIRGSLSIGSSGSL